MNKNWNTHRLPGDPNLPGGCTNAEIDFHMGADIGEEDCNNCGGTGEITEDGEKDQCPECDGNGYTTFSISARRQAAREEAAIDRWEDRRQGGRD